MDLANLAARPVVAEHGDFTPRIKKVVKGPRQATKFLETLSIRHDDYVAIVTPMHSKWNAYSQNVPDALQVIISELGVTQIRPLLLAVAVKFSKEETEKAFRAFVCWTVRFMIAGGMRGQALEDSYSKLAQKVIDGEYTKARELRTAMKDVVPSNATFMSAFEVASVTKERLARYYLRAIESAKRKKESDSPELEPVRNTDRVNLEHILPENPDPRHWNQKPDEIQQLCHKIGNLTLMGKKANEKAANDSFKAKKVAYKNSVLKITQQIAVDFADTDDWDSVTIAKRQSELAKLAVETWKLGFD